MGKTSIEWTDFSWNAWWGCQKVSPACNNCYAETLARRTGHPNLWGVHADRRFFGEHHWSEPLRWNEVALKGGPDGPRPQVFCNSMSDVFDNHLLLDFERERLWALIRKTPALDWLVLTKRIGNAPRMLPPDWGNGYENVWLGISVCEQREADRDIPKLLGVPATIRFLSCEPLLGPIDLAAFQPGCCPACGGAGEVAASGPTTTFPEDDDGIERCYDCGGTGKWEDNEGLCWVIVGGESGAGARSMNIEWARGLKRDCAIQEIPFFMKQLSQADTRHYKDFESFPKDLQVREWPAAL